MNEDETRQLVDRLGLMVPHRPVPLRSLLVATTRAQRRRRAIRVGIAVASAVVAVGAGAVALGSGPGTRASDANVTDTGGPSPSSDSVCSTDMKYEPRFDEPLAAQQPYPTNANGQTYGSDAGVNRDPLKNGPDLVAVVGDCGNAGFVYETDLLGPQPTSPADALRIQQQNEGVPRVLPVYDLLGRIQIDTFTVGGVGSDAAAGTDPSDAGNIPNPGAMVGQPTSALEGSWIVDSMVRFLDDTPVDEALGGDTYVPEQQVDVTFTATTWTVELGCARIQGGYEYGAGRFSTTDATVHGSGSACEDQADSPDVVNVVNLLQRAVVVDASRGGLTFHVNATRPLLTLRPASGRR